MVIKNSLDFYKGKKVLITGHTGFKGSWLTIWLKEIGAEVIGISLDPLSSIDNFCLSGIKEKIKDYRIDIRNFNKIKKVVLLEKPEILFHLAAQPLVIEGYNSPQETFETNVMGTVNMLEIFRLSQSLKTGVFITSDKCYENYEKSQSFKEEDRIGGHDPYSCSKGSSELIINSYRKSYFKDGLKKISSARAGNVIGGGDWSENRIIPDFVRSFESKNDITLRNPTAIRPWQHVIEPLAGYLILGEKLANNSEFDQAWNFGPENNNNVSVEEIVDLMSKYFDYKLKKNKKENKLHEATLLSLDISKAKNLLGWNPVFTLEESVKLTSYWYLNYRNKNVYEICKSQIKTFLEKCS